MNRRRFIVGGIIALLLSVTFKIERIEEVCSLTGSSQQYSRYFSAISTVHRIKKSWIEEVLRSHGQPVPDHRWVRTMGDTWTITSFYRAHATAPITYHVRYFTLSSLRQSLNDGQIVDLAKEFVSGSADRQNQARDKIERAMMGAESGRRDCPIAASPSSHTTVHAGPHTAVPIRRGPFARSEE